MTVLAWHGCINVRDLGGLRTRDGREIRRGALVRADSVAHLRPSGWEALVAHGVRTIVDLRFDAERESDPPRDVAVDVVHVPLFGDADAELSDVLQARIDSEPDLAEQYRLFYGDWLERYPGGFAAAVRAIADAEPGGVLVHCVGGKDRTGLVVALALEVAGVPRPAVAEDYAASEAAFGEEGIGPASAMQGVLDDLDRRHGSARGYLRASGLRDEELNRLRDRLLA